MENIELSSTETVIQNIQEIAEASKKDPSSFQQFLSDLAQKGLSFGVQVIIAVVIFLIGTRVIRVVRRIVSKALEKKDADPGVKQFLDSLLNAALYVLLVFIVLALLGVTTASIVAVLGSAGLAIGLALQGSLSNLAGGVLILLLKPFKVYDYILEDGHKNEGTVTEITIFYTKLRTIDNKTVIVPNGDLANTSIVNYTKAERRQLIYNVGIAYEADLRKAKSLLTELLEKEEERIKELPVHVYVDDLADSSVNLGIRIWVPTVKYWEIRWRIIEEIKLTFDENGIEIPYQKVDILCRQEETSGEANNISGNL